MIGMTDQIVATESLDASSRPHNACPGITRARTGLVLPLTGGPGRTAYKSDTPHLEKYPPLPILHLHCRISSSSHFTARFPPSPIIHTVAPGADCQSLRTSVKFLRSKLTFTHSIL